MKRGIRIILIVVFLVLLLLILAAGFYMASVSLRIQPQTLDEAWAWQKEHYDVSWYEALRKEDFTVKSYDGYVLHAERLFNPVPSDRFVLISHGYTDNHLGSLKYTKMYLDLGFEVILYDLRGHGENEKTFCSYSFREGRDLDCMIRACRERFPDTQVFGLHGESLGAASSIACLRYKPDINFVVSDCGFSDITPIFQSGLTAMHIPGFMVHVASFCAKVMYGCSYSDMRPIESLKDNTVPILFLHGEEDPFILPWHSRKMQEATAGYSELYLIPGAVHAFSVLHAPDVYKEHVSGFLEKVLAGR